MEILKKNIKVIMSEKKITNNSHIIIPDPTKIYNIKIGLTQDAHDVGFFDAYDLET